MAALQGTGAAGARPRSVCAPMMAVADVPVFLMEHVEGTVIDDEETTRALSSRGAAQARPRPGTDACEDPRRRYRCCGTGRAGLAQALRAEAAQTVDSTAGGEPNSGAARSRCPHQTARASTSPESDEIGLVHGDFHVRNVIIDEQQRTRSVLFSTGSSRPWAIRWRTPAVRSPIGRRQARCPAECSLHRCSTAFPLEPR